MILIVIKFEVFMIDLLPETWMLLFSVYDDWFFNLIFPRGIA